MSLFQHLNPLTSPFLLPPVLSTKSQPAVEEESHLSHFTAEDQFLEIFRQANLCDEEGLVLSPFNETKFPLLDPKEDKKIIQLIYHYLSELRTIQALKTPEVDSNIRLTPFKMDIHLTEIFHQILFDNREIKVREIEFVGRTVKWLLGSHVHLKFCLSMLGKHVDPSLIQRYFKGISVQERLSERGSDDDFRIYSSACEEKREILAEECLNYFSEKIENFDASVYGSQFNSYFERFKKKSKNQELALDNVDQKQANDSKQIDSKEEENPLNIEMKKIKIWSIQQFALKNRKNIFAPPDRFLVVSFPTVQKIPLDFIFVNSLKNPCLSSGQALKLPIKQLASTPVIKKGADLQPLEVTCSVEDAQYVLDFLTLNFSVPRNTVFTDKHFPHLVLSIGRYGYRCLSVSLEEKIVNAFFSSFESKTSSLSQSLCSHFIPQFKAHCKDSREQVIFLFNACQLLMSHSKIEDEDILSLWKALEQEGLMDELEQHPAYLHVKQALLNDRIPFSILLHWMQLFAFIGCQSTLKEHKKGYAFFVHFPYQNKKTLKLLLPFSVQNSVQALSDHFKTQAFFSLSSIQSLYQCLIQPNYERLKFSTYFTRLSFQPDVVSKHALEWLHDPFPFIKHIATHLLLASCQSPISESLFSYLILNSLTDPQANFPHSFILVSLEKTTEYSFLNEKEKGSFISALKRNTKQCEQFLEPYQWIQLLIASKQPFLAQVAYQIFKSWKLKTKDKQLVEKEAGMKLLDLLMNTASVDSLFLLKELFKNPSIPIHDKFKGFISVAQTFQKHQSLFASASFELCSLAERLLEQDVSPASPNLFSTVLFNLISYLHQQKHDSYKGDELLLQATHKAWMRPQELSQLWTARIKHLYYQEKNPGLSLSFFKIIQQHQWIQNIQEEEWKLFKWDLAACLIQQNKEELVQDVEILLEQVICSSHLPKSLSFNETILFFISSQIKQGSTSPFILDLLDKAISKVNSEDLPLIGEQAGCFLNAVIRKKLQKTLNLSLSAIETFLLKNEVQQALEAWKKEAYTQYLVEYMQSAIKEKLTLERTSFSLVLNQLINRSSPEIPHLLKEFVQILIEENKLKQAASYLLNHTIADANALALKWIDQGLLSLPVSEWQTILSLLKLYPPHEEKVWIQLLRKAAQSNSREFQQACCEFFQGQAETIVFSNHEMKGKCWLEAVKCWRLIGHSSLYTLLEKESLNFLFPLNGEDPVCIEGYYHLTMGCIEGLSIKALENALEKVLKWQEMIPVHLPYHHEIQATLIKKLKDTQKIETLTVLCRLMKKALESQKLPYYSSLSPAFEKLLKHSQEATVSLRESISELISLGKKENLLNVNSMKSAVDFLTQTAHLGSVKQAMQLIKELLNPKNSSSIKGCPSLFCNLISAAVKEAAITSSEIKDVLELCSQLNLFSKETPALWGRYLLRYLCLKDEIVLFENKDFIDTRVEHYFQIASRVFGDPEMLQKCIQAVLELSRFHIVKEDTQIQLDFKKQFYNRIQLILAVRYQVNKKIVINEQNKESLQNYLPWVIKQVKALKMREDLFYPALYQFIYAYTQAHLTDKKDLWALADTYFYFSGFPSNSDLLAHQMLAQNLMKRFYQKGYFNDSADKLFEYAHLLQIQRLYPSKLNLNAQKEVLIRIFNKFLSSASPFELYRAATILEGIQNEFSNDRLVIDLYQNILNVAKQHPDCHYQNQTLLQMLYYMNCKSGSHLYTIPMIELKRKIFSMLFETAFKMIQKNNSSLHTDLVELALDLTQACFALGNFENCQQYIDQLTQLMPIIKEEVLKNKNFALSFKLVRHLLWGIKISPSKNNHTTVTGFINWLSELQVLPQTNACSEEELQMHCLFLIHEAVENNLNLITVSFKETFKTLCDNWKHSSHFAVRTHVDLTALEVFCPLFQEQSVCIFNESLQQIQNPLVQLILKTEDLSFAKRFEKIILYQIDKLQQEDKKIRDSLFRSWQTTLFDTHYALSATPLEGGDVSLPVVSKAFIQTLKEHYEKLIKTLEPTIQVQEQQTKEIKSSNL